MTEPATTTTPRIDATITRLLDRTTCPACETGTLHNGHCRNCGADLTGSIGIELWNANQRAADALRQRQAVLARVPRTDAAPQSHTAEQAPAAATPASVTAPRASATVQSVLAIAGAGLFAIAAIVFTYFNPELTNHTVRSTLVGLITLLFLGGAGMLARRRLQFSAEAVGALGMVFLALDVHALTTLAPAGLSPWVLAATGTLLSGLAMVALAARARIRTWLWLALLGLAAVPAMLGYAGGTTLAATTGHLGAAFAALALIQLTRTLSPRLDNSLTADQVTLTVVQILAVITVLAQLPRLDTVTGAGYWVTVSAILAAIAVLSAASTRHPARILWSVTAGAAAVAAATALPLALTLPTFAAPQWHLALCAAAGTAALAALAAVIPLKGAIDRAWFAGGSIGMAVVSVVPLVASALMIGALTVLSAPGGGGLLAAVLGGVGVPAVGAGLTAGAIGFAAFAAITRRRVGAAAGTTGAAAFALWLAALAGLVFACTPTLPTWVQIALALTLALAIATALWLAPALRGAKLRVRLPLILGSHFAVLLAAILSWASATLTVWAGIAIVLTIAAIASPLNARVRFLHVGAGYSYALVVVATALGQLGLGTTAVLSLTTAIGLLGALVATILPAVRPASWHAILAVTAVPFVIGVVQVVFERSGWTALSTGTMFLLGLTLLVSRRPGLGVVLRSIAAGILVPSLAVVVVCLGAEVLLVSASPVTLPIIAAIVALTLPTTGMVRSALERRGIRPQDAAAARIAIESSALLTGAIAVVLALVRAAAGLSTSLLVLLILAVGAAAAAHWARRRYGWWVAGASLTGALWCLWGMTGIAVLEPYLLPPSLAAAVIGFILTARGVNGRPLFVTGLLVAIVPTLTVLAVTGSGEAQVAWRALWLLAASWALLLVGMLLGRGDSDRATRLRTLSPLALGVAIVAGAAGAVQGVRFGLGADSAGEPGVPLIVLCLAVGLAGAVPAGAAAWVLARRGAGTESSGRWARARRVFGRWLYAPAALYVGVAAWTAVERDWFTIWAMWSLMLAYLVAMLLVAVRLRRGPTGLPPVWLLFALAFVTAIVAWSPRDLRVEWFSLPLGAMLLFAGVTALRGQDDAAVDKAVETRGSLDSWPARWHGSWALLAPGLAVMLSASIVATFTDPLTWRAILVMVIALAAILVGASLRLAAPFIMGITVLPIENVFVFAVQLGRGIESMPWWITLALVGAVLLIIAVTYERRAGENSGIVARLGDLR